MTERIDKLCGLLENPDKDDLDSGNLGQKNSLKLSLFQLEQHVDELDGKVERLNEKYESDKTNEEFMHSIPLSQVGSQQDINKSSISRQNSQIKINVTKYEYMINDLTFRVSELENSMKRIDPEEIQKLIRNIAEFMINEERKEVSEEMSNIKGSQSKNGQLVDMLQEELKQMDRKLKKDIEKKIEKRDLDVTKMQIRRKVYNLLNVVARTRTEV